MRINFSQRNR